MTAFDDSPAPARIATDGSGGASNIAEFSVSELSMALKRTVEETFEHVRVRGEITGYRGPHSSGHAYFALKDDRSRLEAVIWRTSFSRLAFKPEEGLEVVATGKLTTYPGSSKYQIVIESIEPAGAGALMALLNERRKRFEAEGLFAQSAKRALPFLPRVIGIVTSPTGAVIRDICHRIADRYPVHLLVWPVRVQGETSAAEVAAAIAGFDALPGDGTGPMPRPDVIIVARGGGSIEDLWGFNDEAVVRAAAACTIPLISAIGHETDWTLLDHVADMRAPTPTGAAELAVPVKADLAAHLASLNARHAAGVSRRIAESRRAIAASVRGLPTPDMLLALPRRRLDEAATHIGHALRVSVAEKRRSFSDVAPRLSPGSLDALLREKRSDLRHLGHLGDHRIGALFARQRQRFERSASGLRPHAIEARRMAARLGLDGLKTRLSQGFKLAQAKRRTELAGAWRLAESLDPRRVLSRGYAILRGEDDRAITRADALTPGLRFEVEFAHGERRPAMAGPFGETQGIAPEMGATPKHAAARPRRKPAAGQGSLF